LVTVGVVWAFILGIFAWVWFLLGPHDGTVIIGSALGLTLLWVAVTIVVTNAAGRRRIRAVAAGHPGWTFLLALTTGTQLTSMKAAGKRLAVQAPVTLGWGPDGLGLWTHRRREPVPVFEYTWREVVDVAEAHDLTNLRGYPVPGIRIRLADGTVQDVIVGPTKAIRAAHPGATPAGAVPAAMMNTRGEVAPYPSWPA
jgi:hypothetical protein